MTHENKENAKKTVLILGASGKIGHHSAIAFDAAGWAVKRYTRGTDMNEAAKGVDVIVNGLNPPNYENWEVTIPAITKQVIAAAKASGATVIIPGNIYNFGNQPGVFDENTAQTATTKKGRVRTEMEEAYASAGVQTIILRAGNFIDPTGNGDFLSMIAFRLIAKNKVTSIGEPTAKQTYAYMPDWARAAVRLADMRSQLGVFEDVPFPGHNFTTNELLGAAQKAMGKPVKMVKFPWLFMTLASPFWPLAKEMQEMRYLYSMPHEISGEKFTRLLPDFVPTPLETVMTTGLKD